MRLLKGLTPMFTDEQLQTKLAELEARLDAQPSEYSLSRSEQFWINSEIDSIEKELERRAKRRAKVQWAEGNLSNVTELKSATIN